jgi:uncharacterized membrane protein YgcG
VYISTGDLVQNKLTSSRIGALINGVKPELRSGEYGKALEKLVVEVGLVLASDCKSGACDDASDDTHEENEEDSGSWWLTGLAWGAFASFFAFPYVKNRYDHRQRREVCTKLRKLQNDLKVPSSLLMCCLLVVDQSTSSSRSRCNDCPCL